MLLGYPVYENANIADVGANTFPIAFGNWQNGNLIADLFSTTATRDNVTTPGFVKFYIRRRVGGAMLEGRLGKAGDTHRGVELPLGKAGDCLDSLFGKDDGAVIFLACRRTARRLHHLLGEFPCLAHGASPDALSLTARGRRPEYLPPQRANPERSRQGVPGIPAFLEVPDLCQCEHHVRIDTRKSVQRCELISGLIDDCQCLKRQ